MGYEVGSGEGRVRPSSVGVESIYCPDNVTHFTLCAVFYLYRFLCIAHVWGVIISIYLLTYFVWRSKKAAKNCLKFNVDISRFW